MPPVFFTPHMVNKYIRKLKIKRSSGPDGLPAIFFKSVGPNIVFPLSVIFNISVQSGFVSLIWRTAVVTPVFKKGSPSDPANYRPIFLTCIACKLLKSGIKDALLQHMLTHKLISSHQHGFLSRKSTTTQFFECNFDCCLVISTGANTDVIYLDYSRAFDSVVHSKLTAKLEHYGANPIVIAWILSFPAGRVQCVRVGSCLSNYRDIVSGVPQGSVLGAVLFVIFVNEICNLLP